MLSDDVEFYLEQLHKALGKKGVIYVTAFIEEDVPQIEENPEGYLDRHSVGPLHRVRYERAFFFDLFEKSDLISLISNTKNLNEQNKASLSQEKTAKLLYV